MAESDPPDGGGVDGPTCPFGHPLIPAPPTLNEWGCAGAYMPGKCLRSISRDKNVMGGPGSRCSQESGLSVTGESENDSSNKKKECEQNNSQVSNCEDGRQDDHSEDVVVRISGKNDSNSGEDSRLESRSEDGNVNISGASNNGIQCESNNSQNCNSKDISKDRNISDSSEYGDIRKDPSKDNRQGSSGHVGDIGVSSKSHNDSSSNNNCRVSNVEISEEGSEENSLSCCMNCWRWLTNCWCWVNSNSEDSSKNSRQGSSSHVGDISCISNKNNSGQDSKQDSTLYDETVPRYRCAQNCDFDLCDVCFHILDKSDDLKTRDGSDGSNGNTNGGSMPEPAVIEIVRFLRQRCLKIKQPIPPFSDFAYKRVAHAPGCSDVESRVDWMLDHKEELLNNSHIRGEISNVILLEELQGEQFSEDACKKALFFTGNKDVKSALKWLKEREGDPFIDLPIHGNEVRKCTRGHHLVAAERSDRRWICDGDDDPEGEGCRRGKSSENYLNDDNDVAIFVCEKGTCSDNICDDCIFRPRAKIATKCYDQRSNQAASDKDKVTQNEKKSNQAASDKEKVTQNDKKSNHAASDKEEVAQNDKKSNQAASDTEEVTQNDKKSNQATSDKEKVSQNDKKSNQAASDKEEVTQNDKKSNQAVSDKEKVTQNDKKFKFVDLNEPNPERERFDFHAWEEKIVSVTQNAEVIEHQSFITPLMGCEAVKNIELPGCDHALHHRYIVLSFKGEEGKIFYMSFDKSGGGITAQLHDELDQVKDWRFKKNNMIKRQNPKKIDMQELTGIRRLEYANLPQIGDLLCKWALDLALALGLEPAYSLLKNNCQTCAKYVRKLIADAANGLQLHLPGTNRKADFTDLDELLTYFRYRFPNWETYEFVPIPEVQIQYVVRLEQDAQEMPVHGVSDAIEVSDQASQERQIETDYDELKGKQLGYEGVCKALRGKMFRKDKKAIFFQISRETAERTWKDAAEGGRMLMEPSGRTQSLAEIVRDFWRESLEFVSITSRHGIIIFQYCSTEEEMERDKSLMETRVELLQDLGGFTEKCITTVSILTKSDDKRPDVKPLKVNYGHHFQFTVSKTRILSDVQHCMNRIHEKLPESKAIEAIANRLVTKITVLQNLENETKLVHHKINRQEWGKPGIMLWTDAQRRCIRRGREAFNGNVKPLRLLISGCQGSGKTLLAMGLIKEFVRSPECPNRDQPVCQRDGRPPCPAHSVAFIHVADIFKMLSSELRDYIQRDEEMRDRVIVGNVINTLTQNHLPMVDVNGTPLPIGVLCIDEYGQFLAKLISASSSKNHLILATSRTTATAEKANESLSASESEHRFVQENLEGNFRSPPKVVNLVMKCRDESQSSNIPPKATLEFTAPEPKIILDRWDDRDDFVKRVCEEIRLSIADSGGEDVVVISLCHFSIILAIFRIMKEESERVKFVKPFDILGCQSASIILVIDATSAPTAMTPIVDSLTRATAMVKCVVNTSKEPHKIDGQPSYTAVTPTDHAVLPYLEQLSAKHEGRVYLRDVENRLPKRVRDRLVGKVDFEWRKAGALSSVAEIDANRIVESRFVFVDVTNNLGFSSRIPLPVIQVWLPETEKERKFFESTDPIHDFFRENAPRQIE